jgi:hypothetical protein
VRCTCSAALHSSSKRGPRVDESGRFVPPLATHWLIKARTWPAGGQADPGRGRAGRVLLWTRASGSRLRSAASVPWSTVSACPAAPPLRRDQQRRLGSRVHPQAAVLSGGLLRLELGLELGLGGRPPPAAAGRPPRPTMSPGAARQAPAVGLAAQVGLALLDQGGGNNRMLQHGDPPRFILHWTGTRIAAAACDVCAVDHPLLVPSGTHRLGRGQPGAGGGSVTPHLATAAVLSKGPAWA